MSPPVSTLTGEVPDTSDAPSAAVDTGPLEYQQESTFNIPISIPFTHSTSISGQPDINPENPPTQQSQTTGTTTASSAPHLAGPQSRRSSRLISKMTPVPGKPSEQLHCNENRFRSPDISAPGGPPGRTLSRETPTHQQQRVRRDLSPVPGCSWHPVRFKPSRNPVVTNRDAHFPVPALTGDVPPYSDAPPAAAGAGGPGTSRVSSYHHSNRQEQFSATNSFSRNDRTSDVALTTRFRKRYQNLPATQRTKTTDTTPVDPLPYLPRSLEGTYARPPINNCNKNYPLNTNKAHETDSFLSRKKASSPAPALSADVPALTDEPSAAAGAGGPATPRVSTISRCFSPEQSYGPEPLPDCIPSSPPSHRSHSNNSSSEETLSASANHHNTPPSRDAPQNPVAHRHSRTALQKHPENCTLAVQWNLNSLRANLGEVQIIVARTEPICLALQETHLRDNNNLASWFSHRYTWDTARGSNIYQTIALGIRADIPSETIQLNTELIAVAHRILFPAKCTIVSIYIPQEVNDVGNKLRNLVRQLPTPFLIMGDLNAHHTMWGSSKCCHRGNAIAKVVEETNAITLNDGSITFLRGRASSALDVTMCSSSIASSCGWAVLPDPGNSDHFPISISYGRSLPTTSRRRRWIFEQADWSVYEERILDAIDRDRQYSPEELAEIMSEAATPCIPRTKGTPPKRSVHWWNPEVANILRSRRKALRALKRTTPNNPQWEVLAANFRHLRTTARKAVEEAKSASWSRFLDGINADSSTAELWRRINALNGKRRQRGFTLSLNGTAIVNPGEIANEIGRYFESLSSNDSRPTNFSKRKETLELSPITFIPDSSHTYNRPFSTNELATALGRTHGKSTGLDDIGYPMIKHLPPTGKRALLEAFNRIWEGGPYPDSWRTALIIPIPKRNQGSRSPSDFRPISLLSCVAKTFERLVNRRLTSVLEEGNLLDRRQFAFRKGLGTGVHLGTFGEIINDALADGLHADIAILDVAKAYNTVWREGILRQLHQWGIRGNLGAILRQYLSNRSFRVGIGGTLSDLYKESNGVPQGSVLAATLFLVGMNTVFDSLPKGVYILVYADDIILIVVGKSLAIIQRKLQAAVSAVGRWANSVGFSLSAQKSAIAHCCGSHHIATGRPVTLNGNIIPFRKEPRILGIVIDRKMTLLPHFRQLKKDCESRKRLVRAISNRHTRCNRRTALNVSQALINSRIFYGLELTCRNIDGLISILAPLYNGAVRLASGLLPSTPAEAACVEAGILPFRWEAAVAALKRALLYLEKTSGNDCSILNTARDIHANYTSEPLPKIARLHRVWDRPWYDRGPNIDTSLSRKIKAGDPTKLARIEFNKLVNQKYNNHLHLFTDGSKLNEEVGAGVSGIRAGLSLRLAASCSVFSAEAAAIFTAITQKPIDTPTAVFSDSLSVLTALETGTSKHPYVQAIEANCDTLTTLVWVPGHSDIKGNCEADRLAAIGRKARTMISQEVPTCDIIRAFKQKVEIEFTSLPRWFLASQETLRVELASDEPYSPCLRGFRELDECTPHA
ncbi:uncharacterized protein LOC131693622 [Topomyia yanbarensis]|uniref:uncharacterized protein LOC131693622 n=1 Tax=Topomyia yanbarensis TaxID=2498891 RepID=UPI00273ADBCC|nr:uncharacterized protein LOC131693622 [Topomyia yanbarensis]